MSFSAPSRRWRRRSATAGAPRSSTSWRRASDRSTSSPREIGQSVANTSQHLQVLAQAGLVRSRREGDACLSTASRASESADSGRRCATSPSEHVAEVRCWPRSTSATAPRSSTSRHARACRATRSAATSWSSTCGPEREYRAGHVPAPRPRRSTSSPGSLSDAPEAGGGGRVLPRALLRLCRRRGAAACGLADALRDGSMSAFPNGGGPGCRSRSRPERRRRRCSFDRS